MKTHEVGEDINKGDILKLSDNKLYKADGNSQVVAISIRDIKKGEVIAVPPAGKTKDIIVSIE